MRVILKYEILEKDEGLRPAYVRHEYRIETQNLESYEKLKKHMTIEMELSNCKFRILNDNLMIVEKAGNITFDFCNGKVIFEPDKRITIAVDDVEGYKQTMIILADKIRSKTAAASKNISVFMEPRIQEELSVENVRKLIV